MTRFSAVIALALTACSTPVITGASRESVTMRYDPLLYDRAQIQAQATEQCQEYHGATSGATLASSTDEGLIGYRYDVFDCSTATPTTPTFTAPAPTFIPPPSP